MNHQNHAVDRRGRPMKQFAKNIAATSVATLCLMVLLAGIGIGAATTFTDLGNEWYALDADLDDGVTKFPKWENVQHSTHCTTG